MTEERRWWIFTFGSGQKHAGHYVRFFGTFDEARQQMFDAYGRDWCMQYTEEQWNDWLNRKPDWIPAETELK